MAGGGGCGNDVAGLTASRPLFVVECDGEVQRATADLAVLDWSGGATPLYPHEAFEALDLSAFETAEGGTLADDEALFKERVRLQIHRIFCESPGPIVRVQHADETLSDDGTAVYLTQAVSPVSEFQIGEGEFDVCNKQHDNAAVIFGEQIRQLAGTYTFDEWVLVFSNVTAHEIAHTLGYGHVPRDLHPPTERSLFVELMLDGHTMNELRREQRFVVDQANCRDESPSLYRRLDDPTISCEPIR